MANPNSSYGPLSWEQWQAFLQAQDAIKRGAVPTNPEGGRMGMIPNSPSQKAPVPNSPSSSVVPTPPPFVDFGLSTGNRLQGGQQTPTVVNPWESPATGYPSSMQGAGPPMYGPPIEAATANNPTGIPEGGMAPGQPGFNPVQQATAGGQGYAGPDPVSTPPVIPNIAGSTINEQKNGGVNNPTNLRIGGGDWVGRTTVEGQAFESFSDPKYGYRAMVKNLQSYQKIGVDTVGATIDRMLGVTKDNPIGEKGNDPAAYRTAVKQMTGLNPEDKLDLSNPDQMKAFMRAVTVVEKGADVYGSAARDEGYKLAGANAPVSGATRGSTPAPTKSSSSSGSTPVGEATGPTIETTIPVGGAEKTTGTTPSNEPVTAGRRDTVGGVPSTEAQRKGFTAFASDMAPAFLKAAGGFLQPGPAAIGKGFAGLGEGIQEQDAHQLKTRQVGNQEVMQKAQIDKIRADIQAGKITHLGHGVMFNHVDGKTFQIPQVLASELQLMKARTEGLIGRAGAAGGRIKPEQFMGPDGKTIIPGYFDPGDPGNPYKTMDGSPLPDGFRRVNPSAGISESEARGKGLGKEDAELETLADKAYTQHRPTISRIERMESVAPGQAGQTVWSQGARLVADKLGIPLGDFNPKDINEAKLFFNQAKLKAGEYFKGQGQVSNFERQMLNDAIATLESNPDNLRVALGQMKLAEQYALAKHDAWRAARDGGAQSYRKFSTAFDAANQDDWVARSKALYDKPASGSGQSDGMSTTPSGTRFKVIK